MVLTSSASRPWRRRQHLWAHYRCTSLHDAGLVRSLSKLRGQTCPGCCRVGEQDNQCGTKFNSGKRHGVVGAGVAAFQTEQPCWEPVWKHTLERVWACGRDSEEHCCCCEVLCVLV